MASVPVVLVTIVALGAAFLAVVVGMPVLVAALVVIVIRKQRSDAAPMVAAEGAVGASPAPFESAG